MAEGQKKDKLPFACVGADKWPVVKVRIGRGSAVEFDESKDKKDMIQYLRAMSEILNKKATPENKPWFVFHVNTSVAEGWQMLSGSFMELQTRFCKEYYDRMQALSGGFVIVIESPLMRTIASQLTELFPTSLPLQYCSSLGDAEKALVRLGASETKVQLE